MIYRDPEDDEHLLARFEGAPKDTNTDEDKKIWTRFKKVFSQISKIKIGMGAGIEGGSFDFEVERFSEENGLTDAESNVQNAQARRYAAEAAEIAARVDQNSLEKALKVNEEIRAIHKGVEMPEEMRQLQLMNLAESDPQIKEQIEKLAGMYQILKVVNGVRIQVMDLKKEEKKLEE